MGPRTEEAPSAPISLRPSSSQPRVDLIVQTSQFLTARPSASRICQYLVLHMPWPVKARSAALARCTPDGELSLAGTFAVPQPLVDTYRRMPLFDDSPMAESITTEQPVIVTNHAEFEERYPQVNEDWRIHREYERSSTLVAVPLRSYVGPVGSCGIFFDDAEDHVEELVSIMVTIGALLVVTMESGAVVSDLPSSNGRSGHPRLEDESAGLREVNLSMRQMQILRMIAQGMPNRDIASALGYSESTIRMEATAIFRALGVTGRREAALAARSRGLLV